MAVAFEPLDLSVSPLTQDFYAAIERDDAGAVQSLLDRGADIDARNSVGRTPVMVASLMGCRNALAVLLFRGVDRNAVDDYGFTVQHCLDHIGLLSEENQAKRHALLAFMMMSAEHAAAVEVEPLTA